MENLQDENKNDRSFIQLIALFGVFFLLLWTIWVALFQEKDVVLDKQNYIVESVLESISHHMELPEEAPLVAMIDDAASLKKSQGFYSDAENGDILLIFAEIAVIYRPDSDIIINSGPVVFDQD